MQTKYDIGNEIMFLDSDGYIKKADIVCINIYKDGIEYKIKSEKVFHTVGYVKEQDIIENLEQAKTKIEISYNEKLNKLNKEREKSLNLLEI